MRDSTKNRKTDKSAALVSRQLLRRRVRFFHAAVSAAELRDELSPAPPFAIRIEPSEVPRPQITAVPAREADHMSDTR